MADPTFFDLFQALWGENGTADVITLPQYKAGWAYIGSLPPTVEQFNKVQQLADQKMAWLFQQVKAVADATGQEMNAGTLNLLLHAFQNLNMDDAKSGTLAVARGGTGLGSIGQNQILVGSADGGFVRMSPNEVRALLGAPPVVSISALPTQDIGPVVVAECSEVWIWTSTQYYTGYRSPLCGRPLDGHTVVPLPSEVDAAGGVLPKTAYARLWAYAQENGLVVSQASWSANLGAHYFVDVDANTFRVPDLRNMFRRYTGTDYDTANARTVGSSELDAFQGHMVGNFQVSAGGTAAINRVDSTVVNQGGPLLQSPLVGNFAQVISDGTHGTPRMAQETRPVNVAFHPRVHV